jgi:hypothetical protein
MAAGDITAKRSKYSDFPCNVFDGVDDYVEIPHAEQQLGANLSNGFTISAWINPRSLGESNAGIILDKSENSVDALNGFTLKCATTTRLRFRFGDGGDIYTAEGAFNLSTWFHVLISINNLGVAYHYINGTLSGVPADAGSIASVTTTHVMRIGNPSDSTGRSFNGAIRQVKMWNRVLSTDEITEEYNGTHHKEGCIHFFKLGGDYTDYGSVGVTATNSGSLAANTIPTKVYADVNKTNLAAVTDKLIVLPIEGRDGNFTVLTANRATA